MTDSVTVIGASGALGYGLALRLGIAGTPIVIGSRDAGRARGDRGQARRARCRTARSRASPTARRRARAEVVFLCVPFRNQSETLTNLKEHLREGQLVVDATVPLAAAVSGKATRMLGVWQGSAAQQAAEMVPDGRARRLRAAHGLAPPCSATRRRRPTRTCSCAATRRPTSAQAAEIVERIPGLRCVDCGRLEQSRITEALTAMLIGVNARYKTHAGIRITGLPDALWQPPS